MCPSRQVSPRPPTKRSGVSDAPKAADTARAGIGDELLPDMLQSMPAIESIADVRTTVEGEQSR